MSTPKQFFSHFDTHPQERIKAYRHPVGQELLHNSLSSEGDDMQDEMQFVYQ